VHTGKERVGLDKKQILRENEPKRGETGKRKRKVNVANRRIVGVVLLSGEG